MALPPWMNTSTGSFSAPLAGRQMLSVRQSSLPTGWPRVEAMVSSKRLLAPGPYMRPICRQALPNWRASRTPSQALGSAGGCQRSAPTGAWAKGTPFQ